MLTASSSVVPFQPKPQPERFVMLRYSLLDSSAWKSLSAIERMLYVDIASKFNGRNNGRISYSIREGAKALRIGHHTACRALKLLQRLGLLVRTKHGHFDPGTGQAKDSEWYLPEYGNASEAVATTGKCFGSSGHHRSEAVATTEPKYINKNIHKNLRLPRKEESEEEKRKRWLAEGKSEFTGIPKKTPANGRPPGRPS
jgi:hypothetical protein